MRSVDGTLRVQLHLWRAATAVPVAQVERAALIAAATSREIWRLDLTELMRQASTTPPSLSTAFALLSFTPTDSTSGGQTIATHWLAPFKDVDLPDARPTILSVTQPTPTTATIQLASNATAVFVTVECGEVIGAFSDAGFLLLAGGLPTTLTFTAQEPFELRRFAAALRVRSLRDTLS